MKNTNHFVRRAALAITALFCLAGANLVLAQGKADIGNLSFDRLPSPDLKGTNNKSFKPKDWLEVEVGIKIPAMNREMKESGSLDRLVVKWYVAIEEKSSKRTILLSKDITHINVPVDEEFHSSVYLSPNTVKRITGSDRGVKGKVKVVAVEVLVNGVKVGEETSSMKSGWWNAASLSRGDRYPLLNKNQTPFAAYWWDRYAEIEEPR